MMMNKAVRLQPGDKVLIIQDAYDNVDIYGLVATRGSIGRVVSYKELCREWPSKEGWLFVRRAIEKGEQYPIRFEHVVPPSNAVDEHEPVHVLCREGEIEVLPISFMIVVSS